MSLQTRHLSSVFASSRQYSNCVRHAFTLLELLVVIAVIGILAALLFPVVQGVLQRSKSAECISNLRQIGVAYRIAVIENNNYLLPTFRVDVPQGPNSGSWAQLLHRGAGLDGDWKRNPMFHCPMDKRVPGAANYDGFYRSYGQNLVLCRNIPNGPNLATVPEQSKTFLVMDIVRGFAAHPTFGGSHSPLGIHNGLCNVLFVDGHVEQLTPAVINNAPNNWPGGVPDVTTGPYRWK